MTTTSEPYGGSPPGSETSPSTHPGATGHLLQEQQIPPRRAESSDADKRCPACAELVRAEAVVCRYCSYDWRTNSLVTAPRSTNGLAVASMVVGVFSLLIFLAAPVAVVGAVVALVLGSKGSKQIARSQGLQTGREMARAGVVLGWIALVVSVALLVLAAVAGIEAISFDVTGG